MTYDELVTSIRNYTDVGANVFSSSVIDTFITMAESDILRAVDLDVFKQEVTGNLTPGGKFLTAPSDILTHRYLIVTVGTEQVFLDFRETSFMKEYWPDAAVLGVPKYYSVWDQNTFYIAPTPDQAYSVEVGYIYKPAQLSSTNQTTWVSINAPDALLYASLVQAYLYTKGPLDMLDRFEGKYKSAMQGLGIEQQGRRRRDEYQDGMLRIPLKAD